MDKLIGDCVVISDKDLEDMIAKLIEDARSFREYVETIKHGGTCHNDVWAMVPVEKAKAAGLV